MFVIQTKSTGIISRLTSVNVDYTQPRIPSSCPLHKNIKFKTQICDSVVLCGYEVIILREKRELRLLNEWVLRIMSGEGTKREDREDRIVISFITRTRN
jgi:hypothetical protein